MSGPYDDILYLPHHVSPKRKRMSMVDRGAQFSPFAALTGYDAAIQETGRLTDRDFELDVDGKAMLDEKIRKIRDCIQQRPEITATYFIPDERKSGGAYREIRGRVVKVDSLNQWLVLEDGMVLDFCRIYEISEITK